MLKCKLLEKNIKIRNIKIFQETPITFNIVNLYKFKNISKKTFFAM